MFRFTTFGQRGCNVIFRTCRGLYQWVAIQEVIGARRISSEAVMDFRKTDSERLFQKDSPAISVNHKLVLQAITAPVGKSGIH